MKHGLMLGLLGATLLLSGARTAQADGAPLGTWRMNSFYEEELDTHVKRNIMGERPGGFISYMPDGRMAVIFIDKDRKAPANGAATDAEAAALYRSLLAYMGSYTIEGDKVVHHIEASWNQAWNGVNQTRYFKVEGDKLIIKTAVITSPFTGHPNTVGIVVFDRVK